MNEPFPVPTSVETASNDNVPFIGASLETHPDDAIAGPDAEQQGVADAVTAAAGASSETTMIDARTWDEVNTSSRHVEGDGGDALAAPDAQQESVAEAVTKDVGRDGGVKVEGEGEGKGS